jgi:hypothetical protein
MHQETWVWSETLWRTLARFERCVRPRQWGLFAVAICRRYWSVVHDWRWRRAIETYERFADGTAPREDLDSARAAIKAGRGFNAVGSIANRVIQITGVGGSLGEAYASCDLAAQRVLGKPDPEEARRSAWEQLVPLLRDIVSADPEHPLPARSFPAHILGLAEAIYAVFPAVSGDYLVLADALDDLGEDQAAAHCREAVHVRGCYVLDWITGRA